MTFDDLQDYISFLKKNNDIVVMVENYNTYFM